MNEEKKCNNLLKKKKFDKLKGKIYKNRFSIETELKEGEVIEIKSKKSGVGS